MGAANQRCTRAGVVIGAAERVAPEQSLRGYLLHGQALQAPVRKVEPGADADLCLLNKPWSAIKKQLAEAQVQATICAGKVVYRR
jgi:predicted amidohydrolase YtcJ